MYLLLIFVVLVIIYKKVKKKSNYENLESSETNNLNFSNNTQEDKSYNEQINPLLKEYKIAGVTYENEEGKNIQTLIKKIINEYVKAEEITKDDMYLGYSNSEIKEFDLEVSQYEDIVFNAKIEEAVFDNKPCVKVYMQRADKETYTHVGYIPNKYNQIEEVLDIMKNNQIIKVYLNVVGGKIKTCEIEEDDEYNEHYYIETSTLDYGLRLFIEYENTKEALSY